MLARWLRIVSVVGARPQFIKAAMVSRALREQGMREVLLHTGQHYDANMSQVFFEELDIPQPDYNLGIGGGTHGQNTGCMLEAIEAVLLDEKPDLVLVYGDTDSTLAGALAAAKLHIPVAHVEAGLRSFNRHMPEEINRILTDHVSDILFAPTETAVQNLRQEGIPAERISWVGDVMYDAALYYGGRAEESSRILQHLGLERKGYVLATVHRAENTDVPERLRAILEALGRLHRHLPVVLPLHPRTRKRSREFGLGAYMDSIKAISPVGYLDMLMLEKNARLILTDSGGVQKEAFFFRVPCLTLREETEWVETLEGGWNRLVGATPKRIVEAVEAILNAELPSGQPLGTRDPFGGGQAAGRIAKVVWERFL